MAVREHLDLSAEALVNSGSGLLYALLGIAVLLLRPLRRRSAWLGLFLVAFGARFVVRNLTAEVESSAVAGFHVATACVGTAIVFLLMFLVGDWQGAPAAVRRTVGRMGVVLALLFCVGAPLLWRAEGAYIDAVDIAPAAVRASMLHELTLALLLDLFGVWLVLGSAASATGTPEGRGRLLAALCFAIYAAYDFGSYSTQMMERDLAGGIGYALAEFGAILGALIVLNSHPGGRERQAAAIVLAAAALGLLLGNVAGLQDHGDIGIVRILAAPLLVAAILRFGLLGIPLHRMTVRTGVVASVALAALFVTAQIAQNFLSTRLGLYIGGGVAGVAVFAAFPLQRAAERVLETDAGRRGSPQDQYRRQVELAWADGRLGANERLMLAEFRRQLGLRPEVAERVEEEVARQRMASRPGARRRAPPPQS